MYCIDFDSAWYGFLSAVPLEVQRRFAKRLDKKYVSHPAAGFRHAKFGVPYFVDEIGQYRVCFKSDEHAKTRRFYFIGDHKAYERWLAGHG